MQVHQHMQKESRVMPNFKVRASLLQRAGIQLESRHLRKEGRILLQGVKDSREQRIMHQLARCVTCLIHCKLSIVSNMPEMFAMLSDRCNDPRPHTSFLTRNSSPGGGRLHFKLWPDAFSHQHDWLGPRCEITLLA